MAISKYEYERMLARMADKSTEPISDGAPVPDGQEIKLHRDIMEHCQAQWPTWIYIYHDPTKRTHATEGAPDFVIYSEFGVLSVECKTKNGKRSQAQLIFAAVAGKCGHTIEIVRSMDDFRALVAREKEKRKS